MQRTLIYHSQQHCQHIYPLRLFLSGKVTIAQANSKKILHQMNTIIILRIHVAIIHVCVHLEHTCTYIT